MSEISNTAASQPGIPFDRDRLTRYLQANVADFEGILAIEALQGGRSNPTYRLVTPGASYVLRKRPAGNLLPSAHAIDREYRVMRALQGRIPVPRMIHYCNDESVIGEQFLLMAFVDGRVLPDAGLVEANPTERRELSLQLAKTLGRLHRVDYEAAGLAGFGRPDNYISRQLSRWSRQYNASTLEENVDMTRLKSWLERHLPAEDETAIVHGDYRSHNVIFSPGEPRIVAVVDWELSTIGHPLADLAYCCLPYYLPPEDPKGLGGQSPAALGIPDEADMLAAYCREAGRETLPHWRYLVIFSLYRSAAILAGVLRRAREGSSSDASAPVTRQRFRGTAACAWQLAQSASA